MISHLLSHALWSTVNIVWNLPILKISVWILEEPVDTRLKAALCINTALQCFNIFMAMERHWWQCLWYLLTISILQLCKEYHCGPTHSVRNCLLNLHAETTLYYKAEKWWSDIDDHMLTLKARLGCTVLNSSIPSSELEFINDAGKGVCMRLSKASTILQTIPQWIKPCAEKTWNNIILKLRNLHNSLHQTYTNSILQSIPTDMNISVHTFPFMRTKY